MEYTAYDMMVDIGWISLFMVIGNFLRNRLRIFQQLLLPASITAGLIGLVVGPEVLGWVGFSGQIGAYTTILIAVVFASMAYSMDLGGTVTKGARTMWSYSAGMFMAQWGIFTLLGVYFFTPVFDSPNWFGMMLPVGFVGGFGTAAAVGSSLEGIGATEASSLGFTSATVGTLAAPPDLPTARCPRICAQAILPRKLTARASARRPPIPRLLNRWRCTWVW